MNRQELAAAIRRVEAEIAALKNRWPAHSVKPSMVEQLEELEEELDRLRKMEGEPACPS